MKSKDFETIREWLLTYEKSLTTLNKEIGKKLTEAVNEPVNNLTEISYEQVLHAENSVTTAIHCISSAYEVLK